VAVDGKRLATGRDFDESGRMAADSDAVVLDEEKASGLAESKRMVGRGGLEPPASAVSGPEP